MFPVHNLGESKKARAVWYEGSEDIARGTALCYDITRVGDGISESDARRFNFVAKPDADNVRFFAGIAADDFDAPESGQARVVYIYEPGSCCDVLLTDCNVAALNTPAAFRYSDGKVKATADLYGGGGDILLLQAVDASSEDQLCKALILPAKIGCPLEEVAAADSLPASLCPAGVTVIDGDRSGGSTALADGKFIGEVKSIIFLDVQSGGVTLTGKFGIGASSASSITLGAGGVNAPHVTLVWNGVLWAVVESVDAS